VRSDGDKHDDLTFNAINEPVGNVLNFDVIRAQGREFASFGIARGIWILEDHRDVRGHKGDFH